MIFIESEYLELKREATDELKKEVVAFANTGGGVIVIGVEDDGTVVGLMDIDGAMLRISNMVRDTIKPDITMFVKYERREIDGHTIILLHVQQGTERPYYVSNKGLTPSGVFVRQGVSSAPASESVIRKLIKDTDGDQFEEMRSLDQELTFDYAQNEFSSRQISFGDSQMVTMGLVSGSKKMFTNLAMLLSDQCVHTVKVAKFQGDTKEIFTDRREFSGSLLKQLKDVYEYLDLNNQTRAEINGLDRVDRRDFPEIALREALLNAIIHREYAYSSSTLISILEHRIEVVSVGGLTGGLTLHDIFMGISVARNEKLAAIFYRLRFIEACGTGIAKIMDSYLGEQVKPEIQITEHAFRIVLPNRNKQAKGQSEELTEKEKIVMQMFQTKPSITRKDVEMALGVSQTMAGRVLRVLTEKEFLISTDLGLKTKYRKK